MTAEEWSSCTEPSELLAVLRGKISDRKNRLFNVACCRRMWPVYRQPVQEAILVGELYADGRADREQMRAALRVIHQERARTVLGTPAGLAVHAAGFVAAEFRPDWPLQTLGDTVHVLVYLAPEAEREAVRQRETLATCALIREIFGNPFQRLSLKRAWLSNQVLDLAAALYEDRDVEAMPILADALEEAGCTEAALLEHCRGGGPHVRGCWALDAVLAREQASISR
jgi:hypothetical protein